MFAWVCDFIATHCAVCDYQHAWKTSTGNSAALEVIISRAKADVEK